MFPTQGKDFFHTNSHMPPLKISPGFTRFSRVRFLTTKCRKIGKNRKNLIPAVMFYLSYSDNNDPGKS
jgi:hypothetical protein